MTDTIVLNIVADMESFDMWHYKNIYQSKRSKLVKYDNRGEELSSFSQSLAASHILQIPCLQCNTQSFND